jgi:hypothetical protein
VADVSVLVDILKRYGVFAYAEFIVAVFGITFGYIITRKILKRIESSRSEKNVIEIDDKIIKDKLIRTSMAESSSKDFSKEQPSDFNELVRYLNDKYMLLDVTLATYDGLPIASNSQNPEEDSAMAPELLKSIMKQMNTDTAIISGRDYKLAIFEVSPDVICYARLRRDISIAEIDRIRKEIREFMEVRI